MGKKITMQDIADAARVSKSAVSFAYNTPDRLSSETVEHIFSVAKELGYVRNPVAYMLRTQKTNSLSFVTTTAIRASARKSILFGIYSRYWANL